MDESIRYEWVSDPATRSKICSDILNELPDWFGNEVSLRDYVEKVYQLPVIAARDGDAYVGFLAVLEHTLYAAELCVMGVLEDYHRKGIGRMLVMMAEHYVRGMGKRFFTVKTLSSRDPYEPYQRTRSFYESMGFLALEEFLTLWGEDDPCLMMIKQL